MNDAVKFYLEAAGRLTPDEQHDVAVAIAENLGYRLVEAESGEDDELVVENRVAFALERIARALEAQHPDKRDPRLI